MNDSVTMTHHSKHAQQKQYFKYLKSPSSNEETLFKSTSRYS